MEKVIAKSGQVFDKVQRAVDYNHRYKGVDRMPSIAKKRLLRKKFTKHLFSSFQRTKTTQTSGSVFAERIEKVRKTKFEVKLIKYVDCFLDGHGIYDSNLVSFRTKNLYNKQHFFLQLARVSREYKMLEKNQIWSKNFKSFQILKQKF